MFGFTEDTSFEMEGLQITMEFWSLIFLYLKEHSSKNGELGEKIIIFQGQTNLRNFALCPFFEHYFSY